MLRHVGAQGAQVLSLRFFAIKDQGDASEIQNDLRVLLYLLLGKGMYTVTKYRQQRTRYGLTFLSTRLRLKGCVSTLYNMLLGHAVM